jgi:hypothetical protein
LFWYAVAAGYETQIPRIHRDDLLDHATGILDMVEKRGEISIAVIQPEEGCMAIRWQRSFRGISRLIPVDDIDRRHVGLLALARLSIGKYTLTMNTQTGNTARLQP